MHASFSGNCRAVFFTEEMGHEVSTQDRWNWNDQTLWLNASSEKCSVSLWPALLMYSLRVLAPQ